MADALTPAQMQANITKAQEIISKPWFSSASMNDRPLGSVVRQDLEDRLKNS